MLQESSTETALGMLGIGRTVSTKLPFSFVRVLADVYLLRRRMDAYFLLMPVIPTAYLSGPAPFRVGVPRWMDRQLMSRRRIAFCSVVRLAFDSTAIDRYIPMITSLLHLRFEASSSAPQNRFPPPPLRWSRLIVNHGVCVSIRQLGPVYLHRVHTHKRWRPSMQASGRNVKRTQEPAASARRRAGLCMYLAFGASGTDSLVFISPTVRGTYSVLSKQVRFRLALYVFIPTSTL